MHHGYVSHLANSIGAPEGLGHEAALLPIPLEAIAPSVLGPFGSKIGSKIGSFWLLFEALGELMDA